MGAPSLEVDAMDERLTIATLDSPGCPVGDRIGSFIASEISSELDIASTVTHNLSKGMALLES